MRFNIFEGARRIYWAFAAFWILGWLWYGAFGSTYVRVHYSIDWMGAAPRLVSECGTEDGTEYTDVDDGHGNTAGATLCFRASRSSDGRLLIPYTESESGGYLMNNRYASEVEQYMRAVRGAFQLPPSGPADIAGARRDARFAAMKDAAQGVFFGLLGSWILAALTGWIVRGFAGIPRGQDHRPAQQDH